MLRSAQETLNRGYSHFLLKTGTRRSEMGRSSEVVSLTVVIELLRMPLPKADDIFDAQVVIQKAGRT